MNAYVMTAGQVRVIEGVRGVEVDSNGAVAIRGADAPGAPPETIELSDQTWVAVGTRLPPGWERRAPGEAGTEGGWPPEPPPDVDSEA